MIVPNLREQARKGAVEKACVCALACRSETGLPRSDLLTLRSISICSPNSADTVKMGATFGPWAIKHRDAGALLFVLSTCCADFD